MTFCLTMCLVLSAFLISATIALLVIPIMPAELVFWRILHVQSLRRWITKRRNVHEPLAKERTVRIARKNLQWHLILTFLFFTQIAYAVGSEGSWWSPLAAILIIPCLAYFAGSLVQRQKIAIIQLRELSKTCSRGAE